MCFLNNTIILTSKNLIFKVKTNYAKGIQNRKNYKNLKNKSKSKIELKSLRSLVIIKTFKNSINWKNKEH